MIFLQLAVSGVPPQTVVLPLQQQLLQDQQLPRLVMESPQQVGAVAQALLLAVLEVEIVTLIAIVVVVLYVVKITAELIFRQVEVVGVLAQIAA